MSRIIAAVLVAAVLILPTLLAGGGSLLQKAEAATINITTDTTWGDKTISKGAVVNVAAGATLTIIGKVDLTNAEINVYGTIDITSFKGKLFVNNGGILNIHSGGTLNLINAGTLYIRSSGTLNVNLGGTLNDNGYLRVDGLLDVNPGGTLNVLSDNVHYDIFGTLNIDGKLESDGKLQIFIGGVVRVNNGGIFQNNFDTSIAGGSGGGTLNINNGGELENNHRIFIAPDATLKVFTGGTLDNNDGTIYKECRGAFTLNPGSSFTGNAIEGHACIAINDVSLNEGNSGTTTFAFKVTRSDITTGTTTVDWITAAGTATAGTDYVSRSGTLTFTPGQTTKTVNIGVKGDTTVEPNERFTVRLPGCNDSGLGCTFLDNSGRGTIKNDDG